MHPRLPLVNLALAGVPHRLRGQGRLQFTQSRRPPSAAAMQEKAGSGAAPLPLLWVLWVTGPGLGIRVPRLGVPPVNAKRSECKSPALWQYEPLCNDYWHIHLVISSSIMKSGLTHRVKLPGPTLQKAAALSLLTWFSNIFLWFLPTWEERSSWVQRPFCPQKVTTVPQ